MKPTSIALILLFIGALRPCAAGDWRDVREGLRIPGQKYVDQPYVVLTRDGQWLCVMTTGQGREGRHGQHIVAAISADQGKSWSDLIDIEPASGPEASWVTPLVAPGGRVYVFYTYNGDNMRSVKDHQGKPISRVDTLGQYVFKYSDDHGRTWSARHQIPLRTTEIDRMNVYGGSVKFFWSICKPIAVGESVYVAVSKVGNFGPGFMIHSEGFVFRSDNLLRQADASKARWTMLPPGDVGLRAPRGPIAEEQNLVSLSDDGLYCVYRTVDGFPCHAYSRDGGATWTGPEYATYEPGGRPIKHPRACPRIWKTSNGRYLLWFHNHGGKDYQGRNPAWISGGVEIDGKIHWSEPEILLYDADPKTRMSYPDLIEQAGRYWVTETQKEIARVHEIDPALLEAAWNQHRAKEVARKGLVLELSAEQIKQGGVAMPKLGQGFAVDLWLKLDQWSADQVLLDGRDAKGRGIAVTATSQGTVRLVMGQGAGQASWDCDPGLLQAGKWHHVVFTVDAGARVISVVVDGRLCDGGQARQYGWGRYEPAGPIPGDARIRVAPSLVRSVRIYDRHLLTSEAVGNYRAGL